MSLGAGALFVVLGLWMIFCSNVKQAAPARTSIEESAALVLWPFGRKS
jgi:hypothetical protein